MKYVIGVNFGHGTPDRTKYPDVTPADNVDFQFLVVVKYFQIRVWRCEPTRTKYKFCTELNEKNTMVQSNMQYMLPPPSFKPTGENDQFHFKRDTSMAKISKILLQTILVSSASAQSFEVFSCNDETLDVSKIWVKDRSVKFTPKDCPL